MGSHPGLALLASFVLAQGADDRLPAIDEQAKSPDVQKKAQALLEYAKVGTPEALRRLLPYFEESEHYLVDVATLALSRSASNESLKTVVTETLAKGSPRARVAVLDALTMTKANIGAGDIAAKQLADPEAEVKLQALEVLLVSSPSEVPPAVVKLATSAQADVRQRATALLVWATLDPEAAKATLEKARSDKSPTVRVGAMLGLEKAKAGVAAGLGALADKDRRVRFGAVAMLERARKPEVVPKLIERLPAESGRLKDRIALALKAITGRDFGEDPAAWSRWWSTEGASFSPAPRTAGPPPSASPSDRAETSVAPRYHTLAVTSDRIAFLVDISGSMRESYTPPGESGPRTKLEHAANALYDTLKHLPKEARVTLIVFDDKPLRWKDVGMEMDAKRAEEAKKFLLGINAQRETNVFDSLALVLDDPAVDAIYLVTDGAPSAGAYELDQRILTHVRRVTRFSCVEINTIGIAVNEGAERFLKDLASATGGRFVKR